jgi:hypothetical protein
MDDLLSDDPNGAPVAMRPLSPAGARRRLGSELRVIREAAGLRLEDAGNVLQRSSATMSRLEGGRLVPRLVDVAALLEHYAGLVPQAVSPEVRERVLRLAAESRRKQWFEPFRDVLSGEMVAEHHRRLLEHETDAVGVRNYEPELIPGQLQTRAYAKAVADIFFPGWPQQQRDRFVELRMARQQLLLRPEDRPQYTAVIGESALRRTLGAPAVLREQLTALLDDLDGARENIRVQIIPLTETVPAAIGGPFIVLTAGESGDDDLVYLETRSGADYLQGRANVERFQLYFDNLLQVSLSTAAARRLIEEIAASLDQANG